jgi:cytochrome P450
VIDLLDPELHASGEIMRVFRALPPVSWTEGRRGPGYWSITGHPELVQAARDVEAFSSWWGTRPEVIRPEGARRPLHNLDGDAHAALRAIAMRAVHADRLAALDGELALGSLGGEPDQSFELVRAAERLVSQAFASWLGFRAAPAELLARVVDVHTAGAAMLDTARTDPAWPARTTEAKRATEAMVELVTGELEQARDGTVLRELRDTTPEAIGLAALFLEAGMPTTIDAIASAVVDLARHPTTMDTAVLVDELLRRASPIAQFARRATREVELGGARIRERQQVVLWFAAANHDPRVFPDPDQLRARTPNPHVAFGVGPHRCLGVAVGRRLVRAVVASLQNSRIELIGEPVRRTSSYLRGYATATVSIARL